ncbi:MAG: hypothetical protein ACR2J8_02585 [Thermomicrobiales bacterium]
MAGDDPTRESGEFPGGEPLAAQPVTPDLPPPTNPIEWVRQNRAKAEIIAIGLVSIGLIFCMMALVVIGLWRSARP